MPALLLSPGSLRALVQLVRSLGIASCEETDHGDDPDHLGHLPSRDARPHGGAVGRACCAGTCGAAGPPEGQAPMSSAVQDRAAPHCVCAPSSTSGSRRRSRC